MSRLNFNPKHQAKLNFDNESPRLFVRKKKSAEFAGLNIPLLNYYYCSGSLSKSIERHLHYHSVYIT